MRALARNGSTRSGLCGGRWTAIGAWVTQPVTTAPSRAACGTLLGPGEFGSRELTGYLRGVTRERLVGTNVAGYTMAALVGEGGTSTVYRAEHPQYGTAAVKVLRE